MLPQRRGLATRESVIGDMLPNPGILKLDLAIRGAALDDALRSRDELFHGQEASDANNRSVELVLPGDVLVSAPVDPSGTTDSPYRLVLDKDRILLEAEGEKDDRAEVQVVTPPKYYSKKTRSGIPMWKVCLLYTSDAADE